MPSGQSDQPQGLTRRGLQRGLSQNGELRLKSHCRIPTLAERCTAMVFSVTPQRAIIAALFCTLIVAPQVGWSASAQFDSTVVGLKVVDDRFPADAFEFSPFPGNPGTQLLVMVESHKKRIVGVLHRESRVDSLVGSSGTDLLKDATEPNESTRFRGHGSQIGMFPTLSKDGKLAVIELNAPRSPTPDDVHVDVAAELQLVVADSQETVTLGNLKLEPQSLDVPGHKVSMIHAGLKKDWSDQEKFTIVLQIDGDTQQAIEEVEFEDADGQVIKIEGGSSMTVGQRKTCTYPLEREVTTATIRFKVWRGVETVAVPVKTRQTLGIQGGAAAAGG